jgi:hypothetical protein
VHFLCQSAQCSWAWLLLAVATLLLDRHLTFSISCNHQPAAADETQTAENSRLKIVCMAWIKTGRRYSGQAKYADKMVAFVSIYGKTAAKYGSCQSSS